MNGSDIVTPHTLRFERLLDAPIDKVWQYLVNPKLRARWFMGGPTDAEVGGIIGMSMQHDNLSDGDVPTPQRYRSYLGHSWEERITRIEPPYILAFTWENGEAGEVMFELSDLVGRTKLVLTHSGLRGNGEAIDFGGGWHSHLAVLQRRIVGEPVPDFWALHAKAEVTIKRALGSAARSAASC